MAILSMCETMGWDVLEAACENIGFDITCGTCACIFFTGTGSDIPHDSSCRTNNRETIDVYEDLYKARKALRYIRAMIDFYKNVKIDSSIAAGLEGAIEVGLGEVED